MPIPMCENCKYFREYDDFEFIIDDFQRRMSDGYCYDPDPVDDNMPRFKEDWCFHFNDLYKEMEVNIHNYGKQLTLNKFLVKV